MPYICMNCGGQFEHPTVFVENHNLPFYSEKISLSPCCRDTFMPTMRCAVCGDVLAAGTDHHGMCKKCAVAAVDRLCYFLNNEFTEAEREVLNEAFDGVALTESDKAKVTR